MKKKMYMRFLSIVLSFVMVMSILPVNAIAAEENASTQDDIIQTKVESAEETSEKGQEQDNIALEENPTKAEQDSMNSEEDAVENQEENLIDSVEDSLNTETTDIEMESTENEAVDAEIEADIDIEEDVANVTESEETTDTIQATVPADAIDQGTCGENLTWYLTEDGNLYINGTGKMEDYPDIFSSPWNDHIKKIKSVYLSDGITSIGDCAFCGVEGSDGTVGFSKLSAISIPNSVTSIGDCAFDSCTSLSTISIPNSVTSIGIGAFSQCYNLTTINIPSGVTSIEDQTFWECYSLSAINIPNSVTSIGWEAFHACESLSTISIPSSVTSIGSHAFSDSGLSTISIPSSVTSIGNHTFWCCSNLSTINIPNSVTSIGWAAFSGCSSLSTISIPNSVTSIEDRTFYGCESLNTISIPNSVTSIGYLAFDGCSNLNTISIPNSVTSIGNAAFGDCSSLSTISIPNSVTSIGYKAFDGCSSLSTIRILNKNCEIYDSEYTIISTAVIYGYSNSTAEEYAKKYNRTFKSLDGTGDNQEETPKYNLKYDIKETWGFHNLTDKIPKKYYKKYFGDVISQSISQVRASGKGGQCYGMVNTAMAINEYQSPKLSSYSSKSGTKKAKHLNEVGVNWVDAEMGLSASEYIKYAYLYQLTFTAMEGFIKNYNNLSGLYDKVKKSIKSNGEPVLIHIKRSGMGAHAIWAIGMGEDNSSKAEIYIYDCNRENTVCLLTLYKGNDGSFKSWKYDDGVKAYTEIPKGSGIGSVVWSAGGGSYISFETPTKEFLKTIMKQQSGEVRPMLDSVSGEINTNEVLVSTNTQNTVISLSSGEKVELTPDINLDLGVYIGESVEEDGSYTYFYWINTNEPITFETSETSASYLVATDNSGVDISVPANSKATVSVSEDKENSVNLQVAQGESFKVKYQDTNEDKNVVEEVAISGVASNSSEIKSTQTTDGIVISGISDMKVTVDDGENLMTKEISDVSEEIENKVDLSEKGLDSFDKVQHDFEENIIEESTCVSTGEKELVCKDCGYRKTEEIPMIDHKEVKDSAIEATCTEEGKSEGSHCSVCNTIMKEQAVIPAKGHSIKEAEKITKATLTKDGLISGKCSVCGKEKMTEVIPYPKNIDLSMTSYIYTGKAKKPTVKVTGSNGQIIDSSNYDVVYPSGRINVGTYKLTVKFKGDKYTGSTTKTFIINLGNQTLTGTKEYKKVVGNARFYLDVKRTKGNGALSYKSSNTSVASVTSAGRVTINGAGTAKITVTAAATKSYKKKTFTVTITVNPRGTTLSSVTSGTSANMTVKWAKNSAVTGYEISYATKSDFSNERTYLVTSYKTTSKTIGKRTEGKKYYVRIRCYKTVSGVKYYSAWSAAKTVVILPMAVKVSSVTSAAAGELSANWSQNVNATGYQIQYATKSTFSGAKTVTEANNETLSKTVNGLSSGVKYYVRVRCYKKVGSQNYYSSWSAAKTVVTLPKTTSLSSVTSTAKGKFTAKWTRNSAITGYQIQYATKSDFSNAKTSLVTSYKTTSKIISGLTNGKKYYVRIRCYKTVNGVKYYSAWSSAKTVTVRK